MAADGFGLNAPKSSVNGEKRKRTLFDRMRWATRVPGTERAISAGGADGQVKVNADHTH